jgi:hypothetical protein
VIPRRMAFLAVAALLLAGAGIAAAAVHDDDDGTPAALDQSATTTSTTAPEPTTTTTEPPTTTTSTTPASTTSTTRRGTTTTTRRPATTTTPTTAARPVTDCTAAQIEVTAATDKATFGQGEPVRVDSTLRNRSSTACTYSSYNFSATFYDPAGNMVTGYNQHADGFGPTPFGAGQAQAASVSWDRLTCPEPLCKATTPGDYRVIVTWTFPGGPYTTSRSFRLT